MKSFILFLFLFLISQVAFANLDFETDSSLPLVYVNIGFQSGTVDDPTGASGVTHFVGEMLLRGTQARSKEQIDLELDQMGSQLEVETRQEAMILRGAVLKSELPSFLRLIEDLILNSNFPDKEIAKLKSETISDILEEQGSDSSLAKRRFNSYLFGSHPYGKPIEGTQRDIEKLTSESIRTQYKQVVNKNRIFLVGTGDASESDIRKWFEGLENKLQMGKPPIAVSKPVGAEKNRILIVDKPDRSQTQILSGQIGIRMTDPDFFPLYLGNHIFGGSSFSSRLMQEIRVKKGWSYGASSSFRHGTQPRYWHLYLFPASKDTPAALAKSLEMMRDLKNSGVSREEFDFAKKSLINSSGFMYNTPKKRVENILLEATLQLPKGFMKSYGNALERVTLEQTNLALQNFLHPSQQSIVIVGTASTLRAPLARALGVSEKEIETVSYSRE